MGAGNGVESCAVVVVEYILLDWIGKRIQGQAVLIDFL
jgi:hypothetical protein